MKEHVDTRAAFKEAYASLNAAQKQAVDTIEGPVMVIAGPGTGKTQILTLRIANILLQTDTKPENILALTFTESGAKAMRERLRRYVGSEAYRVPIFTFHGFAQSLISEHPDAFQRVIGGRPATELEKIELIETIIEGGDIQLLRPSGDPSYYITHALREISAMKREYITPDRLAEIITEQEVALTTIEKIHQKGAHKGKVRGEYTKKEKSIAKNRELLTIYRQYEALLSERRLYDFDDMIVETVQALESHEPLLREVQETYQYVLADEHQDVNGSQNRILALLTSYHDSPNIFAVGDEKQAIYRFQGASLENFLYFEDQFHGTTTIDLTQNYRSGQTILDAAHSLIKTDEGPAAALRVPLTAAAVGEARVSLRAFSHAAVEQEWVINAVQSAIDSGTPPADIAIIVRTNREVEAYAEALRKAKIMVTPSADGDILTHPITHHIRELIRAVTETDNEMGLFRVLHGTYWGIEQSDRLRIMAARSYRTTLAEIIASREKLVELGVANPEAVLHVAAVLMTARERAESEAPHRVLEYVLTESGFLAHVHEQDPFEGARVVRRVYDEIESMVVREQMMTLTGVEQALEKSVSYNLPITAPFISVDSAAVQVMTAHKSKGLEFDTVIVPHLADSNWGGKAKRTYFDIPIATRLAPDILDVLDDERRLLYVAMTRAKRTLQLSYAGINQAGKELVPSRLLEDIDSDYVTEHDTKDDEERFDPLSTITPPAKLKLDATFATSILAERGLSATALNNYLKNPWTYVYRNLLRVPEVQPLHMQFGTAMHNVMERTTRAHTADGVVPSDSVIAEWLTLELERLPIGVHEYTRRHEQGLEALLSYIGHAAPSWRKQTEAEKSIRVVLETGLSDLPEVTLTGKLDRIDFNEAGTAVRVVDYKTGKPKTRNVIEGKTQASDGGYKRQLVFYALLLSLYDDDRYATRECMLAFLEPDGKGVIHEESYTITDAEIESLKEEIIGVVAAIVDGSFLAAPCDPAACEYCDLVERLQVGE